MNKLDPRNWTPAEQTKTILEDWIKKNSSIDNKTLSDLAIFHFFTKPYPPKSNEYKGVKTIENEKTQNMIKELFSEHEFTLERLR